MYVLIFAVFIFVCLVVIVVTKKLELGLKKKKMPKPVEGTDPYANLKIGQIYQMENGDIAKYVGDGKFLKVKKE